MATPLNSGFDYKGPDFLDARNRFETIEERDNYNKADLAEGMISYVRSTKKYYRFIPNKDGELIWVDDDESIRKQIEEMINASNEEKEYKVVIQVPNADIGIIYPEVLVDGYIFDEKHQVQVTRIEAYTKVDATAKILFKLMGSHETTLNSEQQQIAAGKIDVGYNNVIIDNIDSDYYNSGCMHLEIVQGYKIPHGMNVIIFLKRICKKDNV